MSGKTFVPMLNTRANFTAHPDGEGVVMVQLDGEKAD